MNICIFTISSSRFMDISFHFYVYCKNFGYFSGFSRFNKQEFPLARA